MAASMHPSHDDRVIPTPEEKKRLDSKLESRPDYSDREFTPPGAGSSAAVSLAASAQLPTRNGIFTLFGFYEEGSGKEHTALVRGDVKGRLDVPVRVHSQCHTGDVWGSLRCDCRDQLEAAIEYISERDFGAVVYVKQEGRGIGLINKIKAYQLQDLGLNTIEANHYLGFPAEARSYSVAARMIQLLGIRSVALLTNNPDKISGLTAEGVDVTRRIPIVIPANRHSAGYLETKREAMGHLL